MISSDKRMSYFLAESHEMGCSPETGHEIAKLGISSLFQDLYVQSVDE